MIQETHRITGTVKWYNNRRNYGFITSDTADTDIFLHHTNSNLSKEELLNPGDRLSFVVEDQEKGPAAIDVNRLIEKNADKTKKKDTGRFSDLGLCSELLRAIKDAGYIDPTPIQAQAIPFVLKGKDMFGCAQTGTGKTAAFALPILHQLINITNSQRNEIQKVRVLCLSPTRELAIQIADNFEIYSKYTKIKTAVIYGGVGQKPQVDKLKKGVDIIVATPGRLLDLIGQGYISLNHIEFFILDEGDRMLDMGFVHDIRKIMAHMPKKKRQSLLFSATIPDNIKKLAGNILKNPISISVTPEKPTLDIIDQFVYHVAKERKQGLLEHLLKDKKLKKVLVFSRTKHGANRIVKKLARFNIGAEPIHGNKSQSARQTALKNFRSGKTRVLVATDVAARGIDVDEITHVIQYDISDVPETYVHRIGRTARAGLGGTAYAFCEAQQRQLFKKIEKIMKMKVSISKHPFMG